MYESKAVKSELSDFIRKLENVRNRAIDHITNEKLNKSGARDLAYVADVTTKNHQLLTGGATENIAINLDISMYQRLVERERRRINASRSDISSEDE